MNIFDITVVRFINGFSRISEPFDNIISYIIGNNLIKGAVIVSVLWYFWFKKSKQLNYNRERIIIGLAASIIAIITSRVLTLFLPFRNRPFQTPNLHFVWPYGMAPKGLETWSSFPSDHAVLFFSLSTCLFFISKKAGIFCYIYTLLVICFPRVYVGFHYPTDILGGAIIGVIITLLISIDKISKPLIQTVFRFSSKYTGLFYVLFFLLTYQISNLFDESLDLLHTVHRVFLMFF